MQLSKQSASAAQISCAKEQPSRWHGLASSHQRGANSVTVAPWHTKSMPQLLITSKAAFLENLLAVSAWILNGSSIECHVYLSVYLVFNLQARRF